MGVKQVRYIIHCPYCGEKYLSRFDRIPTSCGKCKNKFMGKKPKTKMVRI